jgi:predicted nucleotidyltransferase
MTAWPDIDPDAVLAEMIAVLSAALSARLLSVVAFGSYVHGDFEPARSDVELLAVLTDEPTPQDITVIGALLDAVFARHPEWIVRIEAGLVCLRR